MNLFGYDSKDYMTKGGKTLIAGGLGVLVGSVIQTFLNPTGLPLFLTYWIGALFGFVVNFNVQVKWKNIHVERAK